PPPLPTRAPSRRTATDPATIRSIFGISFGSVGLPSWLAPQMLAAARSRPASRRGSSSRKQRSSRRRGTAMNTRLPCWRASTRTGSCGASGLHLTTRAACHAGDSASRRAAASAPTKFGIRPTAPGKRATRRLVSSAQTRSRVACFDPAAVTSSRRRVDLDLHRRALVPVARVHHVERAVRQPHDEVHLGPELHVVPGAGHRLSARVGGRQLLPGIGLVEEGHVDDLLALEIDHSEMLAFLEEKAVAELGRDHVLQDALHEVSPQASLRRRSFIAGTGRAKPLRVSGSISSVSAISSSSAASRVDTRISPPLASPQSRAARLVTVPMAP